MLPFCDSNSSYSSGFSNMDSSRESRSLLEEDGGKTDGGKYQDTVVSGRSGERVEDGGLDAHRNPGGPDDDSNAGPVGRFTESEERRTLNLLTPHEQLAESISGNSHAGTNTSHASADSADRADIRKKDERLGDFELQKATDATTKMMENILSKPRLSQSKPPRHHHRRRHGQELKASDLEKCTEIKLIALREIFKEAGRGNIIVAWRRNVDFNGDGLVNFGEFCKALASMNYEGDALELWMAIDSDMSNNITLDEIDPNAAEVLVFFKQWVKQFGGPSEFFDLVDVDKNGSLNREEFGDGIDGFGWFDDPDCPMNCDTVDEVLDVLFPALDLDGLGTISANELLFLETDSKKKKLLTRKFEKERAKKEGTVVERPQSRKHATRFLHMLVRNSTAVGNVHWTQFKGFPSSPDKNLLVHDNPVTVRKKLSKIRRSKFGSPDPPAWVPSLVKELDRCDLHTASGTQRDIRDGIRESIGKFSQAEEELRMIRTQSERFGSEGSERHQHQPESAHSIDYSDAPIQWRPRLLPSVTKVHVTPKERAAGRARELLRLTYHRVIRRLAEGRTAGLPVSVTMPRQKKTCSSARMCYTQPPIVLPKVVIKNIRRARRRAIALTSMADLRRPEDLFLYYYNEKMY
eukprot:GEMP01014850.1.p1 GENE.GEMP01014850.1~~GEMP01014850.1.p1  ORF type:complete len:635 (+),score=142.03 GEMP01014850.1:64-1968(+)